MMMRPYEEKILPIPRPFDYQNKKMQIGQTGSLDEETSTPVVRIMGMAPIIEHRSVYRRTHR